MTPSYLDQLLDGLKSNLDELLFEGTLFKLPVLYAVTGCDHVGDLEVQNAVRDIRLKQGSYQLKALWLSELLEASQGDSGQYFMSDDRFRGFCISFNGGTIGWALVLGDGEELPKLGGNLLKKSFRIFTSGASSGLIMEQNRVTSYGARETGMVYFAHLLARYALIYGRVPPGDSHEVSHFIEEFCPSVVFIAGEISELERDLVQGLLALGAPVVSLNGDYGLAGVVTVSDSVAGMVDAALELPSIRSRSVERYSYDVDTLIGKRFRSEKLRDEDVEVRVEGSPVSFLVAKPSYDVRADEVKITGSIDSSSGFSVLLELGNQQIEPPMSLWIEAILRRVINYARGVKVTLDQDRPVFAMTGEAVRSGFTLEHLGKLVLSEMIYEFPQIGPMRLSFILDSTENALSNEMKDYVQTRTRLISEANEENVETFYGCVRCRAFALAHACTVTPDRPAQCSKPWYMLKSYAVLAVDAPHGGCSLVEKGECLDPVRGEWTGVNKSTEERSEGRVNRVFLHSIFEYPHTACSCFQNAVWYIPEVDGIALMHRKFSGVAPGGMTWTRLGNMIAGRQNKNGAASFSLAYLQSPKFFQADGGYKRVVWMTSNLKSIVNAVIPEALKGKIATENEVTTLEELKDFILHQ